MTESEIRNKIKNIIAQAVIFEKDKSISFTEDWLEEILVVLIEGLLAECKRDERMKMQVEIGLEGFGNVMAEKDKLRAEGYDVAKKEFSTALEETREEAVREFVKWCVSHLNGSIKTDENLIGDTLGFFQEDIVQHFLQKALEKYTENSDDNT